MSPESSHHSGRDRPGDEIDVGLLKHAQEYLDHLRRRLTPDGPRARAWERFYGTCGPLICRYALACHVPRGELVDCVQQVWTELLIALPDFRYVPRRGRFSSWLYVLVHSK